MNVSCVRGDRAEKMHVFAVTDLLGGLRRIATKAKEHRRRRGHRCSSSGDTHGGAHDESIAPVECRVGERSVRDVRSRV